MEGEDFHHVEGKECVVQDMSLMVTITDLEGESLPEGCLTIHNIVRLCQEKTAHLLYEVSILNDRHALIDFEKGIPIVDVSRELHGTLSCIKTLSFCITVLSTYFPNSSYSNFFSSTRKNV